MIIPTLNEAENITKVMETVRNASKVEAIVVDGGSKDRTIQQALACGAKVMVSPPGRAKQMNTGAAIARGDIFVFLHADTLLPQRFDDHIRQVLLKPDIAAGAFSLRIQGDSVGFRIIELVINWRSRYLQMPYGDQGIFIRAGFFRAVGGFPDMPIMEDFEFIRHLRRHGRIATLSVPVLTSNRRWKYLGMFNTTLINQAVIVGYLAGVRPQRLAQWYQPQYLRGRQTNLKRDENYE